MIATSGLCALIGGVSVISPEVRNQIANATAADAASHLNGLVSGALEYGNTFVRMARDLGGDGTHIMGFAVVALVLTVAMFRT